MSPTRTQSGAQHGSGRCVPKLLYLLLIVLRRKLLIHKRYSRCSRFSCAGTYKELARHPAAPAGPAVTLSSQWDKRSRRAAAHPATCWPYHHRAIDAAHSTLVTLPDPASVTLPDPASLQGRTTAPLHVGTVTRKVITCLPSAPVPLQHPYERRTSTSLRPLTRTSRRTVGSRPTHATHRRVGSLLI
jgi:hypothetical protein